MHQHSGEFNVKVRVYSPASPRTFGSIKPYFASLWEKLFHRFR